MTCNYPTCPAQDLGRDHNSHLVSVPGAPLPMWVGRSRAKVYLRDGTVLSRPQPDAVRLLRWDVENYLARLAGVSA